MKAPANLSPENLAAAIKGGSHKSSWLWWILILGVIGAGIGGWWWWDQNEKAKLGAPAFGTEPVQRGDIKLVVTATGNLEPTNQVTIGSELSGTTQEVFVDTNDKVTKGQPLARIDVRRLSAQIDNSRAALNSAKAKIAQIEATLKENEANLARQQELQKLSGGRTPSEAVMVATRASVARSHADLAAAKAAAQQTEADVRANESDLAKSTIRSPIDGIVLTRTLEPGQTVAASFTAPELFIIAENLENMKLKVAVAEADIGRLANGQMASFTVDAWPDRTYSAKVTKVTFGAVIKDNVVTYEAELEVANDDLSLRPGMTATADINVAESKEVLLVPSAALRFDPEAASALAGGPGGAAKNSFVQTLMFRPRRSGRGGTRPTKDKAEEKVIPGGRARVWILHNGQPEELPVITGLSDGRHVEISGEGVTEGLPVIIRALAPAS
jgi:HlyD family secretion protein